MLHAQVNREPDRLLQAIGGEPGEMQIGEPVAVEPFLDAGNTLIVDVDVADEVGDLGTIRIDALVLREEADAGQAEAIDLRALLGRDIALEPHEAALGGEPLAQLNRIEIGQDGTQQLGRLVDIDDAIGLGKQRGRTHVGRENLAIAVENVGPRGRDRVLRAGAAAEMAVRHRSEGDEARGDDRITEAEDQDGEA